MLRRDIVKGRSDNRQQRRLEAVWFVCPIRFPPIPADTAHAVGTAFGQANLMLAIGDQAPRLFSDLDVGHYPDSPETAVRWFFRPALTTVFQFIEDLPDRRAAEATRARIEWKYALRLRLNHPGLDHTSLCEFRRRLRLRAKSREGFQELLDRLTASGLLRDTNASPWATDTILSTVCTLSRVELVILRTYQALDLLATYEPERLRDSSFLNLYTKYSRKLTKPVTTLPQAQAKLVQEIGSDMLYLMQVVEQSATRGPTWLHESRALRQACSQNFVVESGQATWRAQECVSCTQD